MSETADFAFILRCGSFPLLTYLVMYAPLLNFATPRLKPNFLFR